MSADSEVMIESSTAVYRLTLKEVVKRVVIFWVAVDFLFVAFITAVAGVGAAHFIDQAFVETHAVVTGTEEVFSESGAIGVCRVNYEYIVEPHVYYGMLEDLKSTGWRAGECAETYPVESTILMYHYGVDPSMTVDIKPTAERLTPIMYALSGATILFGSAFLYWGVARIKRRKGLTLILED